MTAAARTLPPGLLAPFCAVFAFFLLSFPAAASGAETVPAGRTHVVAPGETLYSLARRYGVSLERLQAENGIAAPDKVQAGARLRIPAAGDPASAGRAAPANPAATTRPGKTPAPQAAPRSGVAQRWNMPDQTAAIMGNPPKPDPPRQGSLLDVPLKGGGTLSPEHRDPGAVIMSDAAGKEDFSGHALGLRTTLPAGKDTQVVTTLGYGVEASVKKSETSRVGYETDTSIGGLGYGLGIRHSF
ncbi:hypothetical protein ASZ90_001174 [hydrocarbon metagenome]|uniref:LysM domain-containing protein n=1 Tax=hydrocarbon metagenome TaxID=938273 RepID=A0A0W8G718_9ZZZZ